jgi:hypothetical protein
VYDAATFAADGIAEAITFSESDGKVAALFAGEVGGATLESG